MQIWQTELGETEEKKEYLYFPFLFSAFLIFQIGICQSGFPPFSSITKKKKVLCFSPFVLWVISLPVASSPISEDGNNNKFKKENPLLGLHGQRADLISGRWSRLKNLILIFVHTTFPHIERLLLCDVPFRPKIEKENSPLFPTSLVFPHNVTRGIMTPKIPTPLKNSTPLPPFPPRCPFFVQTKNTGKGGK